MADGPRLATPNERVADLIGTLPGSPGAANRQALVDLLTDDPDASAIEVFQAWHPREKIMSTAEANALSTGGDVPDFDPAEDPAPAQDLLRIQQVYDRAKAAGLDDEAEYLRALYRDQQNAFASLLERHYLGPED